ncbi:Hypothetical predicted protein [Olea europaea subsp. europaea]|uniref:Uncharacterized protein n=1 Tax=Olea europaea subsp. europaea TaxID=158383 RepID=A0A8S0TNF1_OLEEU|nr:Hypothetical predicted protein [Olea europaea subsp. europaea]
MAQLLERAQGPARLELGELDPRRWRRRRRPNRKCPKTIISEHLARVHEAGAARPFDGPIVLCTHTGRRLATLPLNNNKKRANIYPEDTPLEGAFLKNERNSRGTLTWWQSSNEQTRSLRVSSSRLPGRSSLTNQLADILQATQTLSISRGPDDLPPRSTVRVQLYEFSLYEFAFERPRGRNSFACLVSSGLVSSRLVATSPAESEIASEPAPHAQPPARVRPRARLRNPRGGLEEISAPTYAGVSLTTRTKLCKAPTIPHAGHSRPVALFQSLKGQAARAISTGRPTCLALVPGAKIGLASAVSRCLAQIANNCLNDKPRRAIPGNCQVVARGSPAAALCPRGHQPGEPRATCQD